MFCALTLVAVCIAGFGFYLAYIEIFVLYLPELHSPFAAIPLWKSTLIWALIAASGLAPLYAAYKTIRFAAAQLKLSS
jgi:hypothetical protein